MACSNMEGENFSKKNFLEGYLAKQKELGKVERLYRTILKTKDTSRIQSIFEISNMKAIEQLRLEKNDIKADVWVAQSNVYKKEKNRQFKQIQCHVTCQEKLMDDIKHLKDAITNIENELSRVNKVNYNLNRVVVPEAQHQQYVAKQRRSVNMLKNQLETGVRRECIITATNANLRQELMNALNYRNFFNNTYSKLVQHLTSDKKYLQEMIEYIMDTYDHLIDGYEKIDALWKKKKKDDTYVVEEIQQIMNLNTREADLNEFISTKMKPRNYKTVPDKEYLRREDFRKRHIKMVNLYNRILDNVLNYTQLRNVDKVIEKYQEQESLYYSFFNFANELGYHMTILNNAVNRLYTQIPQLKTDNTNRFLELTNTIAELEATYLQKRKQNKALKLEQENYDNRIQNMLEQVEVIFSRCAGDATPILENLGNNTFVNLVNVREYTKILEKKLIELVSCVYISERLDVTKSKVDQFVIDDIDKLQLFPTELDEIVLTQQCPECAEGDAFNVDEAGDGTFLPIGVDEAKAHLHEKVRQPEMQYRLHNISQCRLPRSRLLSAKRKYIM